jgi:diguanylate cyclase (GGDEF)-like protein
VLPAVAGWVGCAALAAGCAAWAWERSLRLRAARDRAREAERRLALLTNVAPPLTQAASESVPDTCRRIVERCREILGAPVVVCCIDRGGRLVVGARTGGYAEFLRVGEPCEGDTIVDWVARHGRAAVVGPYAADANLAQVAADLTRDLTAGRCACPLAGSRDRVWVLCLPLQVPRGFGLRPSVIGVLYAERSHEAPFAVHEVQTAQLVAAVAADALQRACFTDDVRREADIDSLTQLLTPSAFRARLRREIELRRHGQAPLSTPRDVALFFIDTDNFKMWNDTFGHAVGDVLLKRVAAILAEIAATGGFAGRNGGDEFCIALLDRTKDDAIAVAEHLRARVEKTDLAASPDGIPAPFIPLTVSIGVAHFPVDVPATAEAPAERLLEFADARMYEAKREGRNRVAYARTRALPNKVRYPGEGPIPRR